MVLLIDNYDSFVFNLSRYLMELGYQTLVKRCDRISLLEIQRLKPSHILISPGPGCPKTAGISVSCILRFSGQIPILGVCLGHQAIAYAFGGKIVRSSPPVHGKGDEITHDQKGLFQGLPNPMKVGRYHSLEVFKKLPACLIPTSRNHSNIIMSLAHREHPTFGVQFHPESILTEFGHSLLNNFLNVKKWFPLKPITSSLSIENI